ncbi:MAG: hypothetical protein PHS71_03150 [Proteiniphilum sp.]|nr:hypothetical protein [Proteiniphilum sp.]MDD4799938.1 hypothetical protein [Proteiniphilum sp.]
MNLLIGIPGIHSGGHGYGLRNTGHTVNEWSFRVLSWLRDIGMVE